MAKEGKIKTSIYLPSELHWKFKEEVVKRRFASDTAAMEAAIRDWIEKTPSEKSERSSDDTELHLEPSRQENKRRRN